MRFKYFLTIIGISLFIYACSQSRNKKSFPNKSTTKASPDTSVYAIFELDSNFWHLRNNKPSDLNSNELIMIDTLLANCIDAYNLVQEQYVKDIKKKYPLRKIDKTNFIIDLPSYKRQYIPTINAKGEKEVWVNCFCNAEYFPWRKSLVIVQDGGNCYFNVVINLTTGKYYNLSVNGDA